jgi:hypothetical protein
MFFTILQAFPKTGKVSLIVEFKLGTFDALPHTIYHQPYGVDRPLSFRQPDDPIIDLRWAFFAGWIGE